MWQNLKAKMTDVVTRTFVNLAQTYVIDDAVGRIVQFLNSTPSGVILGYCEKGLGFRDVDPNYKKDWENTIRGFAKAAFKYGYTDRVLKAIDSITPQIVLEKVTERALKDNAEGCITNIGLIVNSASLSRWFAYNVEDTKEYIRKIFLSAVPVSADGSQKSF